MRLAAAEGCLCSCVNNAAAIHCRTADGIFINDKGHQASAFGTRSWQGIVFELTWLAGTLLLQPFGGWRRCSDVQSACLQPDSSVRHTKGRGSINTFSGGSSGSGSKCSLSKTIHNELPTTRVWDDSHTPLISGHCRKLLEPHHMALQNPETATACCQQPRCLAGGPSSADWPLLPCRRGSWTDISGGRSRLDTIQPQRLQRRQCVANLWQQM